MPRKPASTTSKADQIRAAMAAHPDWTAAQIAKAVGVSPVTVYGVKNRDLKAKSKKVAPAADSAPSAETERLQKQNLALKRLVGVLLAEI